MPRKGLENFRSHQNALGVPGGVRLATDFHIMAVDSVHFWIIQNTHYETSKYLHTARLYWPKCPEAAAWKICSEKNNLISVFSLVVIVAPSGYVRCTRFAARCSFVIVNHWMYDVNTEEHLAANLTHLAQPLTATTTTRLKTEITLIFSQQIHKPSFPLVSTYEFTVINCHA